MISSGLVLLLWVWVDLCFESGLQNNMVFILVIKNMLKKSQLLYSSLFLCTIFVVLAPFFNQMTR